MSMRSLGFWQHAAHHLRALAVAALLLSLVAPLAAGAEGEEGTTPDESATVATVAPVEMTPASEPAPLEPAPVQEPAPVDEQPAAEPVNEPTALPAVPEDERVVAEPTAPPIVPAEAPTVGETPAPTVVPTAEPTVAAMQERGSLSSGTNALQPVIEPLIVANACTPSSQSVTGAQWAVFNCTAENSNPKINITAQSPDWDVVVSVTGPGSTAFTVQMRSKLGAHGSSQGSVTVTEQGKGGSVTLTTTYNPNPVPLPTIDCPGPAGALSYVCTVSPDHSDATGGTLTITVPAGWTAMRDGAPVPSGQAIALTNLSKHSFTLTFDAGCTMPRPTGATSLQVTYSYQRSLNASKSTSVTPTAPDLIRTAPTVSAGAAEFGPLAWSGTGYGTANQSLMLTVGEAGSQCVGEWQLQVSTIGMARTGGGGSIAPESLRYVGMSGAPSGVTAAAGQHLGSGAIPIASGNGPLAPASSWRVNLSLSPPSSAPPGNYSGILVFDTVVSGQ
ncbi:MAG TPA: hypothetical protein VM450_16445 [Thermomicrobiales bacterium]|nr:hypothetical protein [Thermomicrobiales bacterium]